MRAAKLGIADLLANGPRAADDLAQATNVDAPSLYRLLRGLASLGIFAEDGAGARPRPRECLRSDVPGSQRALAIMSGEEHYQAWGELLYSVQTGRTAFDKIFGMPVFEFCPRTSSRPRSSTQRWSASTGGKRQR